LSKKGVPQMYGSNSGPEIDDEVKWNCRLWASNPESVINTLSLRAPGEGFPGGGRFPSGRYIRENIGEFPVTDGLYSSTCCIPDVDFRGMRILPFLPMAIAGFLLSACDGRQNLPYGAFLLDSVDIEPEIQTNEVLRSVFHEASEDFPAAEVSSATPATPTSVAQGATDPQNLPSSLNQSSTTGPDQPQIPVAAPILAPEAPKPKEPEPPKPTV